MTGSREFDVHTIVPSYVCGQWWRPSRFENVADVRDAATDERVTQLDVTGAPTADAIEFARTIGQKSLGELTIHERALALKKIALYLGEHKDELYRVSYSTGATAKDHLIDIDGGIGTLLTFSSKGRRELPNAKVITDGPVEQLSRDGSFLGEHIYTRLPGVAVQINAFNFPVWGMLEKFAPAFIAGVPTLVKPASPTAHVTSVCVGLMVESGFLPEGSLQLLSGPVRDVFDYLDARDHVAFTGSAATAQTLRQHHNVLERGVRFTAETDSLNAAIAAPDITADSPEFDAFIKSIVTEITAKAGQKCTAIRRVIVPVSLRDPLIEALRARIESRVVIGDPRVEGVTMGPLASKDQQREVAKSVERLIEAGGEVLIGGPQARSSLPQEGSFYPVTVLRFADARTPEVHSVEAFGPVTSILTYEGGVDEAVELAALGAGSLVATVCTHDPKVAAEFASGIGAYHGRLLFLDRDDAKTSTGHGSPLPHLVHGGPGRAGGGEELGGVRGVKHYMQRTAIQGSPDLLTGITDVWHWGAKTRTVTRTDVEKGALHPFRRDLRTLRIGDQFCSDLRTVTLDDILDFAKTTGDTFYAHTNEEAAAANPFFPRRVAHGYLLVSWAAGLFVEPAPGPVLANYGLENLRFITPVTYDDAIRVTLTAKQITPRVTDDYGEVRWDARLTNQDDEIVATYDVLTLVAKNWQG